MPVVPIDLEELRSGIRAVSGRLEELLGSLEDGGAPVPGLAWTVGETGAHLVTVLSWFTDYLAGRRRPPGTTAGIADLNQERIAGFEERDPARLATRVREANRGLLEEAEGRSGDDPFPWYDDRTIDLASGLGIALGELVVHGYDLARAAGRAWPIDPHHARLVVAGSLAVLPLYVDPEAAEGFRATYRLRVRGLPSVDLVFKDGEVRVTAPGAGPVDCRLLAHPTDFLLVSYGRTGLAGPILRGRLVAWGRRPWLGTRLPRLLRKP